jgi:hypothetical protein
MHFHALKMPYLIIKIEQIACKKLYLPFLLFDIQSFDFLIYQSALLDSYILNLEL